MQIVEEKEGDKEGRVSVQILIKRHCCFHNFDWGHTNPADCLLRINFISSCNRFGPKIDFGDILIDSLWFIVLNSFKMKRERDL